MIKTNKIERQTLNNNNNKNQKMNGKKQAHTEKNESENVDGKKSETT